MCSTGIIRNHAIQTEDQNAIDIAVRRRPGLLSHVGCSNKQQTVRLFWLSTGKSGTSQRMLTRQQQ